MIYGSVCSGIEAATVAWHGLGWQPAFFSEIEPFPSEVLKTHYPNTPNYGDLTQYNTWPVSPGSIDLLVGGTPCQSFSVAGLRKGLEDPRGNLALVYLGLVDRLKPRWVVWENVPGVLSSSGGRDFGSFLGALEELGYGFAYRILDAQYFGVAQRRRRVFVVGYLGDWRPAAEVLFEPESLCGNPPPSREKGKATTAGFGERVEKRSHWDRDFPHPTLNQSAQASGGVGSSNQEIFSQRGAYLAPVEGSVACYDYLGTQGGGVEVGISPTLKKKDGVATIAARMVPADGKGKNGQDAYDGKIFPVLSNDPATAICANEQRTYTNEGSVFQLRNVVGQPIQEPVAPALTASNDPSRSPQSSEVTQQVAAVHAASMAVRRLTPVECERLQGFPDGYTAIPWRRKPASECPDGPRYKALGNSMAVPVMRWIGQRINAYESK